MAEMVRKAFQYRAAFFRRLKAGERPGYPRNPRFYRAGESRLRRAQRRLARRRKGSERRRAARRQVARAHERTRNQRKDFHHKLARRIVQRFGRISVEDLNVKGLARTRFAKSIHDAGWASFTRILTAKAEDAGREFVKVDARGTSQTCLCGCEVRKGLGDRWHLCPDCGLSAPRDHVSAMLIDRLGGSRHALSTARAVLA